MTMTRPQMTTRPRGLLHNAESCHMASIVPRDAAPPQAARSRLGTPCCPQSKRWHSSLAVVAPRRMLQPTYTDVGVGQHQHRHSLVPCPPVGSRSWWPVGAGPLEG